jgi:hypothetical protein
MRVILIAITILLAACQGHKEECENLREKFLEYEQTVQIIEYSPQRNNLTIRIHHSDNYYLETCVNRFLYLTVFSEVDDIHAYEIISVNITFENIIDSLTILFSKKEIIQFKTELSKNEELLPELKYLFLNTNNNDMVAYDSLIDDLRLNIMKDDFTFEGCYPELVKELYVSNCAENYIWSMKVVAHGISLLEGDFNDIVPKYLSKSCK